MGAEPQKKLDSWVHSEHSQRQKRGGFEALRLSEANECIQWRLFNIAIVCGRMALK
jgi:hypothetical protein